MIDPTDMYRDVQVRGGMLTALVRPTTLRADLPEAERDDEASRAAEAPTEAPPGRVAK